MHDIKWIRDNPAAFDRGLKRRGLAGEAKRLIVINERRRALITKLEQAQARRNVASKETGAAKKSNEEAAAQKLMAEVAELKTAIAAMEKEEKQASEALEKALAEIPNLPADDVPDGTDETGNREEHRFGAKRNFEKEGFAPKQHFDLGEALGQMDFETAAKLSGARFVVLKSGLARMERALGQFMLDLHTGEHGYTEVAPPLLVRDETMFGTAQLPKFAEDQFSTIRKFFDRKEFRENFLVNLERVFGIEIDRGLVAEQVMNSMLQQMLPDEDRLWLIPTAEVPLTNLVAEEILEQDILPQRFVAATPCFRSEAGSAGKDTRGKKGI